MDKTVQKQRNDRHNRKLVRSTEHSWFGDLHAAATASTTDAQPITQHNDGEETNDAAAAGTNTPPSAADNKTIRRLEFFTSLQKQLMNSLGRRSSSGSGSSSTESGNCAIKRNASCRHKTEKRDKLNCQKATLPSSYSSASLAGAAHLSPQQRSSPTQSQPIQSPPAHSRGAAANTTDHHQLSGISESSADQESNNHESASVRSSNRPLTEPNAVEAMFKTCRLSPTIGGGDANTAVTTNRNQNQITNNDSEDTELDAVDTAALILSRSVPNTLTLSPTNPFFSSIEQHLLDQQATVDTSSSLPPLSLTSASQPQQPNKNPFLYDGGNTATTSTPAADYGSYSGGSGSGSRVNSGDSGSDVNVTGKSKTKNNSQTARLQAVTTSSSCSKREEFLKATMKICLVVSPPSNKLQVSALL